MKHAYMIMAHTNFRTLRTLLELLDDSNNYFYIHIDKKSLENVNDYINLDDFVSPIKFIPSMDVRWGHYSQVACELQLLNSAIKSEYDYYHLLSGMDLPIKSLKEINGFFEENSGKEFIHFDKYTLGRNELKRVNYYHYFQPYLKSSRFKLVNSGFSFLNKLGVAIQQLFRRKKNNDVVFFKGANWSSITHKLAEYIISEEAWIRHVFEKTSNPDEYYLQTLVQNSNFREKLYNQDYDDNYQACMRYIDWKRGNPYTWRIEDFNTLIESNYLFARKFNEKVDEEIIKEIAKAIENR